MKKKLITIFVVLAVASAFGQDQATQIKKVPPPTGGPAAGTNPVEHPLQGNQGVGQFDGNVNAPKTPPPGNGQNGIDSGQDPAKLGGFQQGDCPPTPAFSQPSPPQKGDKGDKGAPGQPGRSGKNGRTTVVYVHRQNSYTVWSVIASMKPASQGDIKRLRAEIAAQTARSTGRQISASFFGATTASPSTGAGNAATRSGGNRMDFTNGWLWFGAGMFALGAFLITFWVRGSLPMWLRTNTADIINGVKGRIKERSAGKAASASARSN